MIFILCYYQVSCKPGQLGERKSGKFHQETKTPTYPPTSIVCQRFVCLSVCLSVTSFDLKYNSNPFQKQFALLVARAVFVRRMLKAPPLKSLGLHIYMSSKIGPKKGRLIKCFNFWLKSTFSLNNYPDSHYLQEGLKFVKQISPLLNQINKIQAVWDQLKCLIWQC